MESIIGKKLGMTRIFSDTGTDIPVTLIEAGPCTVTQVKTEAVDGYISVQLAFGDRKPKRVTRPAKGHLKKSGLSGAQNLHEFHTSGEMTTGDIVRVDIFKPGDIVKVTGTSKGRGFTGRMKRYGFHGGRASHGKKDQLRAGGSIGASSDPSRVWPGIKMAGRSGNEKRSVRNLEVVKVLPEQNQIFIRGAVPGARYGTVYITKLK